MITLETAVGPRIKRINNALDRCRNRNMEALELTSSQAFLLGYLCRNADRPVYPGELGRELGLSHPTVTGILQRLESKGFLVYVQDADRRKKRIQPSQRALQCHQQIIQSYRETEERISAGMSPAQRKQLLELLDRIIDNLGADARCPARKEEPHA